MEPINSPQNKWVKYIKSLQQRKYREKERSFLLEGIRLIEEALESDWPLQLVAYSNRLQESSRGLKLLQVLEARRIPLLYLSNGLLEKTGDTQTTQGVLAVALEKEVGWEELWQGSKNPVLVIIDGVQDPGNLGTIIRTADATGAQGILLTKGTADLYNPKTIRSTMGSIFHLPIIKIEDLKLCLEQLKDKGIKTVVGDLTAEEYCFDQDYTGSVAICVGNEGVGPSAELKETAQELVKIPMFGQAESFNVAVAAGILLYEINRQRLGNQ